MAYDEDAEDGTADGCPAVGASELKAMLDADRRFLMETLDACKTKLQVYRAHSDGEYRGGMEHRALIQRIEQAHKILASNGPLNRRAE